VKITVVNTGILRHIAQTADAYQFNRQIDVTGVDVEGLHVVQVVLPFHQPAMPKQDGPVWPEHHRCKVLMKMTGESAPNEVFVDIPVALFDTLPTINVDEEEKA
jgi:hypothetical protein